MGEAVNELMRKLVKESNIKTVRDFVSPSGRVDHLSTKRHLEAGGRVLFHSIEYSGEEMQARMRDAAARAGVSPEDISRMYGDPGNW